MSLNSTNSRYVGIRQPFKLKKNSLGIGLPVAIFVITVLAMVVVALTSLEESSGTGFSLEINTTSAFYAAESGAQIAVNRVFPPSGVGADACAAGMYNRSFNAPGLRGCSVIVNCFSNTLLGQQYFTFTSIGQCGSGIDQAERTIEVRLRQ